MKKFMLVLTVAAVLFGAFALTGCNGKNATESYRNVYLVSAIAGANYLQQSADASDFYAGVSADGSYFASARVGASGLYVADTENASGETAGRPEEIARDMDSFNRYVNMFDGLISGNTLNAELEKPDESKDGEFAVYQKKLIAYVAGEQYVMYFDETDTKTETEIDDGVEEVEISSKVTGVLVKGEYVFEVSGKYETEREGTEIETEREFVTRSFDTPDNYVKVEQAVESDEIEYEYSIYENGRLVSKTKVEWEDPEFEDDDDDKGLTMQFKSDSGDGYSKTKYHVIKDKNNRLRVTYKTDSERGSFFIQQTETENIYTYENGYEETLSR